MIVQSDAFMALKVGFVAFFLVANSELTANVSQELCFVTLLEVV